ncbi:MAG: four-helix bundle copper-binding protein [Methanomassiliicoccus sp.]|nr:four-helix bundle copper-binding protein [Methanomassiliicoccus sp.]
MAEMTMSERSDTVEGCIQACRECNETCLGTMTYCLSRGGEHAEVSHMKMMRDCEEICSTSVQSMIRSSKFSPDFCDLCAKICDECAASCEQFDDDRQMSACAETCRNCAKACRDMSSVPM